MKIEAVFVDRDGVLNTHLPGDYVKSPDALVILPGVARAVRRLNEASVPVIVISNQQGVGKGLMTERDLQAIERQMAEALERETGAYLDRCYYCTDLAGTASPRRKPAPGMLQEAARDLGLTLAHTLFAGDSATDIAAGRAAGVGATLLLLSGSTPEYYPELMDPAPDQIFADLPAAVDWILERRR